MPYPPEQINYTRVGIGPPALLVHGNPATMSLWSPLAERLREHRTLYLVDLPGFGGTPPPEAPEEYALERLARTLLAFADLHGLERFDLVGHSFGGAISITMAALAPERVRTLAALTPLTDAPPPLARLARSRAAIGTSDFIWRHAPGRLRRWTIRNWAHVSYGAGYTRARALRIAEEGNRPDLLRSVSNLAAHADYKRYGELIEAPGTLGTMPLLLVGAGRDRVIPFAHFMRLAARLPHATVHVFPRSGHVPIWQYPDEIAKLIRALWAGDD